MKQFTKDDLNAFILKSFQEEHCRITNNTTASETDFAAFSESYLFFMTMTFSKAHSTSNSNTDLYMNSFRKTYYQMVREVLGVRFREELHYQPLTFICLDSDGSRYFSFGLNSAQNLHIHALVLVHPDKLEAFTALDMERFRSNSQLIDSIQIAKFDPRHSRVERLISYITKATQPNRDTGIFWDFLPPNLEKRFAAQERINRLLNFKAANMSGENSAATKLKGKVVMSTSIQPTDDRKAKIEDWATKLKACSDRTVGSILEFAKMLSDAEADVVKLGKGALRELRKAIGLSQSMLSKLKRIGDRAEEFERDKSNLPASLSTLYEMSMLDSEKFKACVSTDQKKATRSDIKELRKPREPRKTQSLISFVTDLNIDETKLAKITKEIKEAVEEISRQNGLKIKTASEPFEEKKVEKEKARLRMNAAKAKQKKNDSRAREEFKKFAKELSNTKVKRVDRDSKFVERFGLPYSQLMKLKDPTLQYMRYHSPDWISHEERLAYEEKLSQNEVQQLSEEDEPASNGDMRPMFMPMLGA